jgi:hypothetical protein
MSLVSLFVVLTAVSACTATVISDLIHGSNHVLGSRAAVARRDTVQLFNTSQVKALSSACASAMAASVSCSNLLTSPNALYTLNSFTADDLATMCTDACTSSLASYRSKVATACANDVIASLVQNASTEIPGTNTYSDIYNLQGSSIRPIKLVDYFATSYSLNCLKDT